ncbi:MAG: tail fiber domain-containing protein [Bacteroidales bacterium]|nr:tail fiber domain-containing protein [Bacteroidales bacterium]
MKKNIIIKTLFAISITCCCNINSFAQLPNSFNYQAVVNAENGYPISNKDITVEISILQGTDCEKNDGCPVLWQELHYPTTNDFGLFTVEIGDSKATNTTLGTCNSYSEIDWLDVSKGCYYLKVRADFGESKYKNVMSDLGISKFSSVPYSMVAQKSEESNLTHEVLADANGKISNKLSQLADVEVGSATANQILVFNGTKWICQDPAKSKGLENIDINSPTNGQILVFDGTNWVNKNSSVNLSDINDVSISSAVNKQFLQYNETDQKWINHTLVANDISGVSISSSPANGDLLTFDNGFWKNKPASEQQGVTKLSELTGDVSISTPSTDQILQYDGTKWVNKTFSGGSLWSKNTTTPNNIYYNTGNVGIGTEKPSSLFEIYGGGKTTSFTGNGIVIGGNGSALGAGSIALTGGQATGAGCIASGTSEATGEYSVALGLENKVSTEYSMAFGNKNEINSFGYSFAFGSYLQGCGNQSLTIGKNNISNENFVFCIGWGANQNNRANILTVDNGGNISYTGTASSTSDKRLKTNISSLNNSLSQVMKLEGVSFNWDKTKSIKSSADEKLHFGFIAQDLEKIFPNLVSEDSNGYKTVNYTEVIPVLTEAIKEQQNQIDNLTKENQELKQTLQELIQRVEKLEK